MSQTCFEYSVDDLQRLEAETALKEQEAIQARARLAAALQSQRSTASTAIVPEFLPQPRPQSHFQLSSSPPSAPQDVRTRSIPRNGPMAQTGSQPQMARYQQNPHHPMKRTKTTHAQPQQSTMSLTTNMVRSKSSSAAPNPFTGGSGRVKPISPLQSSQPPNMDMMENFLHESEQQQPANIYVLAHSMSNPMMPQPHKSGLPTVAEGGTMEDPGMWLMRNGGGMDGSTADSHIGAGTVPAFQPFSAPGAFEPYQPQGLPTSQCGSLTSGPTMETLMTRTNSNANQSVSGPMQMMRLNSQSSMNDSYPSPDYGSFGHPGQHFPSSNKRNAPDDDLLQIGSGNGLGDGSLAPAGYSANMNRSISVDSRRSMGFGNYSPPQTTGATDNSQDTIFAIPMQRAQTSETHRSSSQSYGSLNLGLHFDQGAAMERSISASSAKSTHSQRLRAKDSLQRQIAAGTQLLAPKPAADPNKPESNSQQGTKSGKDGKVAVTKAKYERPKHPKVKCGQCDEYPEGFRGEHELRRHTEAKHGSVVKKFVCVDPAVLGIKTDYKPFTPLDKCKHCKGAKEYGAYYNAAAHLRRAHFCKKLPRAKGPKTGNSNDAEASERRGGKGGGDWPPMAELKKWMEERSVSMNDKGALDEGTVPDEEEMQNYDEGFDGTLPAAYSLPAGDATFYGVGSNLPIDNTDVYHSMLGMHDHFGGSPVQLDTMGMMPSIGSANFDFKSSISNDLNQGMSVGPNAYHSPDVSSSATLTAYNNIMGPQQFSQGPGQATNLAMSQPIHDAIGDLEFSMVFGMNEGC
ncbi:hypothetical protein VSDG_03334 [Cytospora chrysosperma]|uniref:DUF7896 domain-containing protein n=1 Tax=Cytospora chrysosperma TaxID=252740 RepID=A0A423WB38_CYTCH|nr:hypothetical protein VSDG_03334 [Valsa sordida]